MFDDELALLNQGRMDAWELAYEKIDALGLRLVPLAEGADIEEFILHVEGDEVWFRY